MEKSLYQQDDPARPLAEQSGSAPTLTAGERATEVKSVDQHGFGLGWLATVASTDMAPFSRAEST